MSSSILTIDLPTKVRHACEKAIGLARKSIIESDGEPHPYVGATILDSRGGFLAGGSRREDGKSHAEVCAIAKVANSSKGKAHFLVTTLEPCSYRGDASKICCAKTIVRLGIKECIIGTLDPASGVRGRGAQILQMRDVFFTMFPRDLRDDVLDANKSYIGFASKLYGSGRKVLPKKGIVKDDREFDLRLAPPPVMNYLMSGAFAAHARKLHKKIKEIGAAGSAVDFAEYFAILASDSSSEVRAALEASKGADPSLYELIATYEAVPPGRTKPEADAERQIVYQYVGDWWYRYGRRKR